MTEPLIGQAIFPTRAGQSQITITLNRIGPPPSPLAIRPNHLGWWMREHERLTRSKPIEWTRRYQRWHRERHWRDRARMAVGFGTLWLHDLNGGASSPYTTGSFTTSGTTDLFANIGTNDTATISSVTLSGSGTQIVQTVGAGGVNPETSQAYYWLSVAAGTYSLTITGIGAGIGICTQVFDLTGVNHSTVINGTPQTVNSGALSTPTTMTVSSATGNMVIGQISIDLSSGVTDDSGGGATTISDDVVNLHSFNSQRYPGAGSVTVKWTYGAGLTDGTAIAYDVKAAGASNTVDQADDIRAARRRLPRVNPIFLRRRGSEIYRMAA